MSEFGQKALEVTGTVLLAVGYAAGGASVATALIGEHLMHQADAAVATYDNADAEQTLRGDGEDLVDYGLDGAIAMTLIMGARTTIRVIAQDRRRRLAQSDKPE